MPREPIAPDLFTPDVVKSLLTHVLPPVVIHGLGDIDEIAERLAPLGKRAVRAVIETIPAAWPVSQLLTADIIERVPEALSCIRPDQVAEWVNGALARYESAGLEGARRYLDDVEKQFLCRVAGQRGYALGGIKGRLGVYLSAVSGRRITVDEGPRPSTDGRGITLPGTIELPGARREDYEVCYKYSATLQWAAVRYGTFLFPDPLGFFAEFPRRSLAIYIWNILETARLGGWIRRRFPGLDRDMWSRRDVLIRARPDPSTAHMLPEVLCRLGMGDPRADLGLSGAGFDFHSAEGRERMACLRRVVHRMKQASAGAGVLKESIRTVYGAIETREDGPDLPALPLYGLHLSPEELPGLRDSVRKVIREEYVDTLSAVMLEAGSERVRSEEPETGFGGGRDREDGEGAAVVVGAEGLIDDSAETRLLTMAETTGDEGRERLEDLTEQIRDDLGGVPAEYVSAAQGRAGRSEPLPGMPGGSARDEQIPGAGAGGLLYDEWDARRGDYRKKWCRVVELAAPRAEGNFVAAALREHYGTVHTLRRQFEMLRRQERFLKRERDGDDIDLDSAVEALGDMRAGLSPSERLFIRLVRDERDISTLFLVDMSASTEGWVGTTIKESLVLLCEALERLGDRYGIFGFSGMRRSRSEWYPIKKFDEPYDETVRSRITGIVPRDYTRMGPAIRHATRVLLGEESRLRLLLTLSDGKPEDYDDYKGAYAVEDTRKALIEARQAGVHPFCITVDREARDYLPHMFGDSRYILVPDVRLLPGRVPEIYRAITT